MHTRGVSERTATRAALGESAVVARSSHAPDTNDAVPSPQRDDRPRTGVIVQLNDVGTIDWAGLQALRTLINRARASGHHLVVSGDRVGLGAQLAQRGAPLRRASMRISRIAPGSWTVARSLQTAPRQLPEGMTGGQIS